MAYYQCFKTRARDVYCSSYPVNNHAEAAIWISQAVEHFELRGNDILGKPFESDDIPAGAITYP